jgi:hypothetical protein
MNTTFSLEEQDQIKKLEIEEEKRQQYRAVFNKIRSALEKRPEPQRAFWELMQNARDYSDNAIVKIELHNDVLSFSHQGISFTKSTSINTIKAIAIFKAIIISSKIGGIGIIKNKTAASKYNATPTSAFFIC